MTASTTNVEPLLGQVLAGKYRVERVLGRGGMGCVLEATHVHLQQRVALKFMLAAHATAPNLVQRFLREARAAARLRGEHVARVVDVGRLEDGAPYIVMEFLDGSDLRKVLKSGPLTIGDALTYMMQACEGVAEAHAAGVVHRDLKPHNLFITQTPQGRPCLKVLDFGLAKLQSDDPARVEEGLTEASSVLGSPRYMAPEQLRASGNIDARTDVWALGVSLYQCLTGHTPFETPDGLVALAALVLSTPPTPLHAHRSDIPPELAAIVMRCLEKDPSQRFANAAELGVALEAVAARLGALPTDSVNLMKSLRRSSPELFEPSNTFNVAPPVAIPSDTRSKWNISQSVVRPSGRSKLYIAFGLVGVLGILGAGLVVATWTRTQPSASGGAVAAQSGAPVVATQTPKAGDSTTVELDAPSQAVPLPSATSPFPVPSASSTAAVSSSASASRRVPGTKAKPGAPGGAPARIDPRRKRDDILNHL